ncbi:DUF805 domain-containing protein [Nonlabens sp. Asnod2-A12]|uniref:DUF805 domain-containing protein n=1 Tax=Nonlabens sp. Asnod2-A12 TaxID=3160578 RepID=UPI003864FE44
MDNFDNNNNTYRQRRGREEYQPAATNDAGMFEMIGKCFTNYANFTGRARRSEYWYFRLFNFIVLFFFFFIFMLLGSVKEMRVVLLIIYILYVLATIVPSVAVTVRRLHDTSRSGWSFLLGFVPVASIMLLIFLTEDSKYGANQWGVNPKGLGSDNFNAPKNQYNDGF